MEVLIHVAMTVWGGCVCPSILHCGQAGCIFVVPSIVCSGGAHNLCLQCRAYVFKQFKDRVLFLV